MGMNILHGFGHFCTCAVKGTLGHLQSKHSSKRLLLKNGFVIVEIGNVMNPHLWIYHKSSTMNNSWLILCSLYTLPIDY